MWRRSVLLVVLVVSSFSLSSIHAQTDTAPCGYVDGFDFPVDDVDLEHTDFGIYRARFEGLHTGIDVAFEQLGDPVRAAARGRVTYSDPAGWDTEKGVVVIQHTFPDGTLVNTIYGHMEELNGHTFPAMNQCVEQGDVIGAVGFPSLGRPHLHYEIRTRYRHEGGPGYTDVNPLELSWLHPIDFTYLARLWINPAHQQHLSLAEPATQPPILVPDGSLIIAQNNHLVGMTAAGQALWRFDTLGSVTMLQALPDGRVLASTSNNQILVLNNNGSYSALWQAPFTATESILWNNSVVFVADNQTVAAYTPEGIALWTTPTLPGSVKRWAISGDRLALGLSSGDLWIIDAAGTIRYQTAYPDLPVPFGVTNGEFILLTGSTMSRIDSAFQVTMLFDTGRELTSEAEWLQATDGTSYIYPGEGRSFYAYGTDGALLWIAYMPGSHLDAPRFGLGGGRLIYALTTDGQLLAYATDNGQLVGQFALYNGGIDGFADKRWLDVRQDDTVHFSSGYLSLVTLDGLKLLDQQTTQN
jgi:murein DD-endopeptidase MepM/ murein hydrolase activator NlpD